MKLDLGPLRPLSRRQALQCALASTAGLAGLAFTSRVDAATPAGLSALREGVLIAGRAVGNSLWVSDNRGQLFASDDGGASWRVQGSRARGAITSLAFGSGLAIAVGHRSALLRSGDGGTQWAAATLPAQESVSLLDAVVLSPTHALAVGAFGAYWRSHDAGLSWVAAQPIAGDRHYNAIAGNAQGQLVIVGEGGLILRSADGGQSWAEVASPVKASLFAVVATLSGHFIAAGLGGTVLVSVDGGAQWEATHTAGHNSWLGASLLSDDSVLLAGHGGALCRLAPVRESSSVRVARQVREGYGAWSTLLPCTPKGGAASLLAVGETGLLRLDRAAWVAS